MAVGPVGERSPVGPIPIKPKDEKAASSMATHTETVGEEKGGKHGEKRLQCVVVTPEKTWLDELTDSVVLPAYDGELGILPGHTPVIARLGYGELRTRKGESVQHYFVDGGFAQVRDDVVTVLTHRAIPAAQIDPAAAAKELERVESQRAVTDHEFADQQRAVARARGMIRVARHRG
jgi:F-type H+-transporting ATPase subunit epsilon